MEAPVGSGGYVSVKELVILANQVDLAAIDELLSLLPEMETWRGPFGQWVKPERQSDGSFVMGYFEQDERLERYRSALHRDFWSVLGHPDYRLQETYNAIVAGTDFSAANLDQIRFALFATVCVDKWVEGGLAELFESNRVVPLVKRLRALRQRF